MPPPFLRRHWLLLTLLAALLAGAAWLAAEALFDSGIPFLPARAGASWILYPTPPVSLSQPAVDVDTVFRRAFVLDRRPLVATLDVLWFRRGAVWLNGTLIAQSAPGRSWKLSTRVEVARLLLPGENRIVARVVNGSGPPALCLSLAAGSRPLKTDGAWEASLAGATWRPARLAMTPMSEWSSPGSPTPGAETSSPAVAARANLPLLLLFAALTVAALAAFRSWERRRVAPARFTGRGATILFLAVAVAWGALFWNARRLSPDWGFDSPSHLEYVRSILERGRLPLADEGWEMYQPPLYYLLAAGLLRLTGHSAVDATAVPVLHGLGWLAGLVQIAALLAGLRLLFDDRARPVLAGLCLAAFLPMQFYVFQYVSNEGLHAALATLALVLALRILKREETSPRSHLALGAVLGLAMLTKFSALVTVAAVGAVLAGRLTARRVWAPLVWARTLGCLALGLLLVCGWHYARVTLRFGKPLVGNWDAAAGFAWWMDPGYGTAGQLVRFGRSLTAPVFSAFHSLPDAIYSTLWGDGLLGGATVISLRPPWNYGLMAAGYLLALLPSLALLVGLAAALVRFVRAPRAEAALLLGALFATAFAVVALALKLPFYAQAKAFYGLSAMLPICALAAWGCEVLTRRQRLAGALVYVLLGTWSLCSYFTFWVAGGSTGEPSPAALAALDPEGLLARSEAAARRGDREEAVALARRATALAPDRPAAWSQLGFLLAGAGRSAEAIDALREALRTAPRDPEIHDRLARLYVLQGEAQLARYHLQTAARLPR